MRKALLIGGVLLAGVALLAGALLLIDVNQFREPIQAQAEKALGRKVTLGEMKLGLFPLAIRIQNAAVAEDPRIPLDRPFLTAKQIDVHLALLPLLRKQLEIGSIRVLAPTIELVKVPAGSWNFSSLSKNEPQPANDSPSGLTLGELIIENGEAAITELATKKRDVYKGIDLKLRDFAPGKPLHATLTVHLPQNLSLDADIAASFDPQTRVLDLTSVDAKLGGLLVKAKGKIDASNAPAKLALQIQTKDSSITELARTAAAFGTAFAPSMKVEGTLNADIQVSGTAGEPALNGNLLLRSMKIERDGWKQPVRIAEAKVSLTPATIETNEFTVESGGTRILAAGRVTNYARPEGRFLAALRATNANFGELLNVASAYGVAADGVSGSGTASVDVKASGSLKGGALDINGSARLENAILNTPALTKPVQIKQAALRFEEDRAVLEKFSAIVGATNLGGSFTLRNFRSPQVQFDFAADQIDAAEIQALLKESSQTAAQKREPLQLRGAGKLAVGRLVAQGLTLTKVQSQCTIEDGVIKLDPLTAELFGGTYGGAITIDTRPDPATYGVRAKLERVDADQLLSVTTSLKKILFGILGGEADLKFTPKPGEHFAKNLNGTFSLRLTDGKLGGVNLLNEAAGVAKLLGFRRHDSLVTNIVKLTANMKLDNGTASSDDIRLDFDSGSMGAAGSLNLVDQSLKMRVTTILSKAISDQFKGNAIGGLLSTALSNSKGEIIVPSLVSGSASKPQFLPDAQEIAKLRAQGTSAAGVLGAIEGARKGDVRGVLDAITGKPKAETPAADAGQQPSEFKKPAVGEGLIDLFRKRKK